MSPADPGDVTTPRSCWISEYEVRAACPSELAPHALVAALTQACLDGHVPLLECVPAAQSLLLRLVPSNARNASTLVRIDHALVAAIAQHAAKSTPAGLTRAPVLHHVPVCYDPRAFASANLVRGGGDALHGDLELVAAAAGCSVAALIELHCQARYTVRFLGFSPGFAYLDGLPPALHVPRKSQPSVRIPARSVAIAGAQAGIYPDATPGGWHLLGRTTASVFDPQRIPPALFMPGDELRFVPISFGEFVATSPPDSRVSSI